MGAFKPSVGLKIERSAYFMILYEYGSTLVNNKNWYGEGATLDSFLPHPSLGSTNKVLISGAYPPPQTNAQNLRGVKVIYV